MVELNWDEIEDKSITIEAITANPPCVGCLELIKVVAELGLEHGDKLNIINYVGKMGEEAFKKYGITAVPAVVVNDTVRIMGVAPSKETMIMAIGEACGQL